MLKTSMQWLQKKIVIVITYWRIQDSKLTVHTNESYDLSNQVLWFSIFIKFDITKNDGKKLFNDF